MSNKKSNPNSILNITEKFLDSVTLSRSSNTARTYRNGMNKFLETLSDNDCNPDLEDISVLNEDAIIWFTRDLKGYSATSERLYLTAVTQFFEYLAAENIVPVNLSRVRLLIKQRARRPGQRLPQFPRNAIEEVLDYCQIFSTSPVEDVNEKLRNLRDSAFLITLADTGLRVHEACNLRRGDIDWNEGRAIIIGKGNREAIVRFSLRSQKAIKDYLSERSKIDGSSGSPLSALPIFARHDKGAGKKIKPITTATGRNIVTQRVKEALGEEAVGSITPPFFQTLFCHHSSASFRQFKISPGIGQTQKYSRYNSLRTSFR